MPEYIEREALMERLESLTIIIEGLRFGKSSISEFSIRYKNSILKAINEFPAADVVPVRHGRWERTADGAALCTACKRKMNPSQYGYAFCGLCGAKMDLSDECEQEVER